MESRKFTRIGFESEALVMVDSQTFPALSENLSLNGIFLRTDKKIPIGQRAVISFDLPSVSRSSSITVNGIVVRNDLNGIAFQFEALDQDSFTHLKTVINRKSKNRLKPYFST